MQYEGVESLYHTKIVCLQDLTPTPLFDNTRGKAVRGYMEFVRAGVDQPSAWDSLRGQIYLGSEGFANRGQVLQSNNSAATINSMIRPLRIELASGLYHVTSRGDRREDISLIQTKSADK